MYRSLKYRKQNLLAKAMSRSAYSKGKGRKELNVKPKTAQVQTASNSYYVESLSLVFL